MKEHEIKLKVTEEELNEILDARMSNNDMVESLMCQATSSLSRFLDNNGFKKNFISTLSRALLKHIEEDFSRKKAIGTHSMEEILDFEDMITFYVSLNPEENTEKIKGCFTEKNLIKFLIDDLNHWKDKGDCE